MASEAASLKVNLLPPTIEIQPTDVAVTEKKTATFSVTATGTLLEYQWQRSSDEAAPFEDIPGATNSVYMIEVTIRGQCLELPLHCSQYRQRGRE